MVAKRKAPTARYRLMVVELDDVEPRNESNKPNLAVIKTVIDPEERFALLKEGTQGPKWLHGHVKDLRKDLASETVFSTNERVERAKKKLIEKLLRQGYIVNRSVHHRRVYVIELDPSHLKNPVKGYLYVGETSKHPEIRFKEHRTGGRLSAKVVKKHGLKVRLDLAPKGFYLSVAESEKAEAVCRQGLEARGYRCEGAHSLRKMKNDT